MPKHYDEEDVKYYVLEAEKDLIQYGNAPFKYKNVVRLDNKIYLVTRPENYDWRTHEPKYHEFIDLEEDWDKALTDLVIDQNGYKGDVRYHCDGYLYHDEAV